MGIDRSNETPAFATATLPASVLVDDPQNEATKLQELAQSIAGDEASTNSREARTGASQLSNTTSFRRSPWYEDWASISCSIQASVGIPETVPGKSRVEMLPFFTSL